LPATTEDQKRKELREEDAICYLLLCT